MSSFDWLKNIRQGVLRSRRRFSSGQFQTLEPRLVLAEDWGDAPDTVAGPAGSGEYPTRAFSNGARHTIVAGLFLGTNIDAESTGASNTQANGDDSNPSGGPDDEDGVVNPLVDLMLTTGTQPTVTLRATNTTGTDATLTGFIDFGNDGEFSEFTDRVQVTVPTGTNNGTFTLTFPIIPTGSEGKTWARFRLGQDFQSGFQSGLSASGEVEDYSVTITGPSDGTVKTGGASKLASGGTNVPTLADGDRFGSSIAHIGDLNGDGFGDLAVGATQGGSGVGSVDILFLNASGGVISSTRIASGLNGGPTLANGDSFGVSVAHLGDLNGDGVSDLAVGASADDTGGTDRGAVHILFLNTDGTVSSSLKIASGQSGGPALTNDDRFGSSIANLGDLDGDGVPDLAVGSLLDDAGGSDRGAVHILFLNDNGTVKSSTKIANGLNGGPTLVNNDGFGRSVANLGDLNGDGVADLAVGARIGNAGGTTRGAVHILFLNASGMVTSSTQIASETNGGPTLADGDYFGRSLANVGDLDGDGVVDLAVGARGDDTGGDSRGAVHLLSLNPGGTVKSSKKIANAANGGPTLADLDYFGWSVTNLGDIDGDGGTDIAVGATGDATGGTGRGAVHILRLNNVGELRDFGDAPDATNGTGVGNYQTRNADGGASHTLVSGMLLGSKISGEVDATANARANGDDIGTDDEDGVVNPQMDLVLTTLTQPTITLRATNNVGTSGKITGWIDTNNNGVFETSESAVVSVPAFSTNGTYTLTFPVIPQGFTGTTYARFRLSENTVAATSPTGAITGGEVEDYVVTITAPSTGTVKIGGSTKLASGGANMPSLANIDYFGSAVANLGDLDGDGVADLAVGASGDDTGGAYRGVVHFLYLNADGTLKSHSTIASGFNGGPALADNDYFGSSVTNLGDFDGDGVTDLAVGAPGDDTNGGGRGAVHLLFLNANGSVKSSTKIASGTGGGPTLMDGGRFGTSVANMGDLDGNGVADLAVGAVSDSTGGSSRGAVYILFLNSSGTVTASTKLAHGATNMPALADTDRFGSSVANVGDLDGDGVADLAVGARGDDTGGPFEGGAVHILLLNTSGGVKASGAKKITNATGGGPALVADSYFGSSLANVGDLDGDGLADLAVGALRDDTQGANRGAVYLLFLNANGTTKPSVKLASGVANVPTLANGDHFGSSVANLGDLDGDGVTDLAIGAYLDDTGGTDRGAVHILRLNAANLAPTGLNLSANTIAENSAVNTAIGTFTTTDAASTFTYTLVTGTGAENNADFTISGNQLQSAVIFNFELVTTRSIRVRTTDAGGLFFEQSFTINIANSNETPIGLGLSNTTILETIANGAAVGDLSTTDPDAGNTFTYTLVAGTGSTNNAAFTIVGNQLRVNTNVDNDNANFYSVRIRSTDQGGLSTENSFTITVTNVDEAPTALALSGQTIAENLPAGTPIGTFSSTDPDTSNTFTYTLVAGSGATNNGSFTIVGNQLQSNAVLNFEATPTLSIRVRTTDQSNLFFDRTFIITVTNANEAPVLDNSGNIFAILGVGSRQSLEMRKGVLVSDLLARGAGGNPINDVDAGALGGIAITAVDQSLGNFQFTTVVDPISDSQWFNVDAQGPLSESSALLLRPTARIRFVSGRIPHHDAPNVFLALESRLDAGLAFRAWDQTSGVESGRANTTANGGSTAFSTAVETSKIYFEARLFRHFNRTAELNVYTLEAEFNALAAGNNPAFEDRSTDAFTGFTVLLSNVPELSTTPLYRMYYGVQFNPNGTEIDMGYRYLTTNLVEAQILENSGPADKRPERAGTYFRELGVNGGTGILGYIYTTQQPGTQQVRQIYRTDVVQKPTRPPGTSEGGPPTSFTPQENGDHVYTTNTAFEMSKTGAWRVEDPRGFVRPLGGSGIIAPATAAPAAGRASAAPVVQSAMRVDDGSAGSTATSILPVTFTDVLPVSLGTSVPGIGTDKVSAAVCVGLITPPTPATQPLPMNNDSAATETMEPTSLIASEPADPSANADDLFALIGAKAADLCPW